MERNGNMLQSSYIKSNSIIWRSEFGIIRRGEYAQLFDHFFALFF
jgi:hypothetical protein